MWSTAITVLVALLAPLFWSTTPIHPSTLGELLEPLRPISVWTLEVVSALLSDSPTLAVLSSLPSNFLEGIVDEGQFAVVSIPGHMETAPAKTPAPMPKAPATSVELDSLTSRCLWLLFGTFMALCDTFFPHFSPSPSALRLLRASIPSLFWIASWWFSPPGWEPSLVGLAPLSHRVGCQPKQ